jgi:hypothetical protein
VLTAERPGLSDVTFFCLYLLARPPARYIPQSTTPHNQLRAEGLHSPSGAPAALLSPRQADNFSFPFEEDNSFFSRLFSMLPLQLAAPSPCSPCSLASLGGAVCCGGRCSYHSTPCIGGAVCRLVGAAMCSYHSTPCRWSAVCCGGRCSYHSTPCRWSDVCCVGKCSNPCSPCSWCAVCCVGRCSNPRPQSLQLARFLLCWQMPLPPHGLQY